MKFIFTVATYYPSVDGVQMVTQNIAEALVNRGHEVEVVVSSKGKKNLYDFKYNGVAITYVNLYTDKDKIVGDKRDYLKFIKTKCDTADVLINVANHSAFTDALFPYLNEIKCYKILYLHGIYSFKWTREDFTSIKRFFSKCYYNIRRFFYYKEFYKDARKYDLIIHLSEDDPSLEYMVKHDISQNLVLKNAAEPVFFEISEHRTERKYFLHVANYNNRKNQEFALQAYYKSGVTDIDYIFVGAEDNKYYYQLIDLNEKLEMEYGKRNIEFLHGIERKETIRLFKNAYTIILSSRVENYPKVLVEGMACGVPFISTDCGLVKSLPGGTVVYSIDEMAKMMSMYHDSLETVTKLSKEGREYAVHNYSLDNNINKILNKINSIN